MCHLKLHFSTKLGSVLSVNLQLYMRKYKGISWRNLKSHLCVMLPCTGNNVVGDVFVSVGDK